MMPLASFVEADNLHVNSDAKVQDFIIMKLKNGILIQFQLFSLLM